MTKVKYYDKLGEHRATIETNAAGVSIEKQVYKRYGVTTTKRCMTKYHEPLSEALMARRGLFPH